MSVKEEIEQLTRNLLQERLAQCTTSQRAMFNRMYPQGVPADRLESAIDLCDRTIKKNREGRNEFQRMGEGAGSGRC